jgi:Flp pilus assembly protein TadG
VRRRRRVDRPRQDDLPKRSWREHGQSVLLLVVGTSIFLIAALGLAIDGGQMYAQRQMAQAAADAAAQAGMMSIFRGTNATATFPFGTGIPPIASSACTKTDGRTPCVYARLNGFGATASDTVTLSFPATVTGVTLPSVPIPAFAVTVQRSIKTGLIRFVGAAATSTITAKATAGLDGTVSPDCIIVLDPSAQNAFLVNNGATVAATGCQIAVNSTNAQAASIAAGSSVTGKELDIVGGCSCVGGFPTLKTAQPTVADPFASLPAPAVGSCAAHPTMYTAGSGATIMPGTYCGGITVSNGVTGVTFAAGDYIINGGGLTFGGGVTVSGSNLMFYLTGTNATYASLTIANGVTVTLSGPTSGIYQGVLFYQDRTITSSSNATFAGGANMNLTGSLYFPTTNVSFSNGVSGADTTAIVAKQVSFVGGADIKYDPTGSLTGLFSKAIALMQ